MNCARVMVRRYNGKPHATTRLTHPKRGHRPQQKIGHVEAKTFNTEWLPSGRHEDGLN